MELVGESGWWLGEDIPGAAIDGKFRAPGGDSSGRLGAKDPRWTRGSLLKCRWDPEGNGVATAEFGGEGERGVTYGFPE